jgi:hypothetical protein
MRTKQHPLAYRAPEPDLPPELIFQGTPIRTKRFSVSAFFSGFTLFFSKPTPSSSPFPGFFSDLFDGNTYTILPYPFLKTVK